MKHAILFSGILILFMSCSEEKLDMTGENDYYLKGMFNGTEQLNLGYPDELISNKYYGNYVWGMASDKSYASEGPILTFPFDASNDEYLWIVFHQKFSDAMFNSVSDLPLIQDINVLMDTLINMDYTFYSSFKDNPGYQGIEIRYINDDDWHSFSYEDGVYSSEYNNANNTFSITSIAEHVDSEFGNGILIEGSFSCRLFKFYTTQEYIDCKDMKFKGFLKFPR